MYEAEYHPKIRKDLKKIDPPIREKIRSEHIPNILSDPGAGENPAEDLTENTLICSLVYDNRINEWKP